MEFGRICNPDETDFTLPPDAAYNAHVWASTESSRQPQVFIGGPIWANKSYAGHIYPSNAKDNQFLHHYVRQFNTIELNLTHYQSPTPAMLDRWRTEAGQKPNGSFLFCPKFPQLISHERMLVATETATDAFVNALLELNPFLGMSFLQLPPQFAPGRWPVLKAYLEALPTELPVAVEFRHADWFGPVIWPRTLAALQALGRHVVTTDVAGRRDVLHMGLSSSVLTLRFIANEGHPTDYSRVDAWIDRLNTWFDNGLQTAYLFIHGGGDNDTAPALIQYWIRRLNAVCGLTLREPVIQPKAVQGSLF